MKPLYATAFGVVLLLLGPRDDQPGVFDPAPDPLGWLFILIGVYGLTRAVVVPRRGAILGFGSAAFVSSCCLVVPSVDRWISTDPSLGWAAGLPWLVCLALLCHGLVPRAREAGKIGAFAWLQWTAIGFTASALVPVLVFGADTDNLEFLVGTLPALAQLSLVALCITYGNKEWAGAPVAVDGKADDVPTGSDRASEDDPEG
ncbi:hypothetical protein [Nocardioides sp. MH1]|uniref:hypothetical protein n=1 Tax=Nocardioides sp. MH1 TaxID=3242490 RepID=UPI0035202AF1